MTFLVGFFKLKTLIQSTSTFNFNPKLKSNMSGKIKKERKYTIIMLCEHCLQYFSNSQRGKILLSV